MLPTQVLARSDRLERLRIVLIDSPNTLVALEMVRVLGPDKFHIFSIRSFVFSIKLNDGDSEEGECASCFD